jgi:hypothetical protein
MVLEMGDWILDTLESMNDTIAQQSPLDMTFWCAVGILALPFLALVHELGHAVAVRVRGLPLKAIVVGDAADLTVRGGTATLQLGRVLGDGRLRGHVLYESTRASASDMIVVALAGPLANLVAAPAFAAVALADATGGMLDADLWLLTLASVLLGVGNLIPHGMPGSPGPVSDGRHIQIAWERRGTPVSEWTDVIAPAPEAPAPPASPPPAGAFRWPFKAALLLVALAVVAAGGALMLLPLIVLFGGAWLSGAHRRRLTRR